MRKFKKYLIIFAAVLVLLALVAGGAVFMLKSARSKGQEIGSVDTALHLGGADKISIEAYEDPLVDGVTCYMSRARTGGFAGTFGVAEDKTEASIACRQTKEQITLHGALPANQDMFSVKMSAVFKTLHVVRMVDTQRNVLLYMTYSDLVADGSPKNSISAVPVAQSTKIIVK